MKLALIALLVLISGCSIGHTTYTDPSGAKFDVGWSDFIYHKEIGEAEAKDGKGSSIRLRGLIKSTDAETVKAVIEAGGAVAGQVATQVLKAAAKP